MFAPEATRCVAQVCRQMWVLPGCAVPAARAYRWAVTAMATRSGMEAKLASGMERKRPSSEQPVGGEDVEGRVADEGLLRRQ